MTPESYSLMLVALERIVHAISAGALAFLALSAARLRPRFWSAYAATFMVLLLADSRHVVVNFHLGVFFVVALWYVAETTVGSLVALLLVRRAGSPRRSEALAT